MAVNGVDVVEQLRGRMRFYHVGDPVRKDIGWICDEVDGLRSQVEELEERVLPRPQLITAASVGAWHDKNDVKLLPWQRKRLGLAPTPKEPRKAKNT